MTGENNSKNDSKHIDNYLKGLVIARIKASMSSNLKLSIGGDVGSLTKEQMINHINKNDDVGTRIIQTHLRFMKAQASGQLTSALNTI